MATPALRAFAHHRDGGERLTFGGTTITVRASADTTDGGFTVFEESAPLLDTSAHVHRDEDELYYVLEGDHVFVCGDEEHRLGPGGVVFLPRGVPHAHRRVVAGAGRLLSMTSPAGFEGFFRLLAAADRRGEDLAAAYAEASQRFGITWLG